MSTYEIRKVGNNGYGGHSNYVVLPRKYAERLQITKGDLLKFTEHEGTIILERLER